MDFRNEGDKAQDDDDDVATIVDVHANVDALSTPAIPRGEWEKQARIQHRMREMLLGQIMPWPEYWLAWQAGKEQQLDIIRKVAAKCRSTN